MERVKVRSVPYGKIYRPVFDAEEQLIQSIKSHKIRHKTAPSPNLSSSYSSVDRYECESQVVDNEGNGVEVNGLGLS